MKKVTEIKEADKEKEKPISVKLNEAERLAIRGLLQQIGNLQNQLAAICADIAESRGIKLDGEVNWQTDAEMKSLTGIRKI